MAKKESDKEILKRINSGKYTLYEGGKTGNK